MAYEVCFALIQKLFGSVFNYLQYLQIDKQAS